jgi:hypothetical protein
MSYFIATVSLTKGRKPVGRTIYPIKQEAIAHLPPGNFIVMDADHEPGRSILRNRGA